MNESLSLFTDAGDLAAGTPGKEPPGKEPPGKGSLGNEPPGKEPSRPDQHLAAARRLARGMRRYADHSPEQRAAGQRICRHLIAMLRAAQSEPGSSQH